MFTLATARSSAGRSKEVAMEDVPGDGERMRESGLSRSLRASARSVRGGRGLSTHISQVVKYGCRSRDGCRKLVTYLQLPPGHAAETPIGSERL